MRRYDPNPTFLTKASGIKHRRHTRALIALAIITVLSLVTAFIMWEAHMQSVYKKKFPEMVGAATAVRTSRTTEGSSESSAEDSTTESATEETTTTAIAPVIPTAESSEPAEVTGETEPDYSPDPLPSYEPVIFSSGHPVQTVSHEERDMMLEALQQSVRSYITDNPDARICFRYVNLASNETLGVNDLSPVIPAGAFSLPTGIRYCEAVAEGIITPADLCEYYGDVHPEHPSWIEENYPAGKQFYLATALELAITRNDGHALAYVESRLGSYEAIGEAAAEISGYIPFNRQVTYEDYSGTIMRGNMRSCVYDLAGLMEYVYYGYINDSETYLPLIGAMNESQMPTPFRTAFGDEALILHISGRNEESHSYTDIAIIDGEEPLILAISVECSSYDRANTIMADLSGYLHDFLAACHQ